MTYPLTTLGWIGVVVTIVALFTFAAGAPSARDWILVASSGLFAASMLVVGYRRSRTRFGVPLITDAKNGVAINVAVTLAALQLAGGVAALGKSIVDGGSGSGTTIINQRICPESPDFAFPQERS